MAIPTNSMEHIFGAGDRRAKALNLKEKLTEGSLEGRKAVHHLIKQINNDTAVYVTRDAEGKLKWSVGETDINFAEATEGPSFWERIKHKWNMAFDTEYQAEFAEKINKIVLAYSLFHSEESLAKTEQAEADAAALAAAEAAAAAEAEAAAQAILDAAAAKAAQIAGLKIQIATKNGELTNCQTAQGDLTAQKAALQTQIDNLNTAKTNEQTLMSQFKTNYNALVVVHEKNVVLFWNDEETALAQAAADLLGASIDNIKSKDYRDLWIPTLLRSYHASQAKITQHDQSIQEKADAMLALNDAETSNNAVIATLTTEIADLTAQLLVLEPADVPAADVPPADDVPVPAEPPVVSAAVQDGLLDLTQVEIDHYQTLSALEKQLYGNLRQVGDNGQISSAFADFMTVIAKGRMSTFTSDNDGKTQNIVFTDNSVVMQLKFDDLQGQLTLPQNISLTYSEGNKEWTLDSDQEIKVLRDDGREIKLNNTKFNIDNNQITLTLDSSRQEFGVRLYLALTSNKSLSNNEVIQTVFNGDFIQEVAV